MTITILKLINSIEPINTLTATKLPIKLTVALKKIMDEIDVPTREFFKRRNYLLEKYTDKETNTIQKDKIEEVNTEVKTMIDEEVELNITPIKLETLEAAGVELSVAEYTALEFILE